MKKEAGVPRAVNEPEQNPRLQFALNLAQLPQPVQMVHRSMKVLEAVSFCSIVALFMAALYVSITWKGRLDPIAVPFWWMSFALGQAVFVILVGLHGVIVKAMPPATVFLRKQGRLATDRRAVRRGWLVVGAGLVWAAIWVGLYRYLVYSGLDPLDTFIAFVVGLSFVAALIGILSSVLGGRLRLL